MSSTPATTRNRNRRSVSLVIGRMCRASPVQSKRRAPKRSQVAPTSVGLRFAAELVRRNAIPSAERAVERVRVLEAEQKCDLRIAEPSGAQVSTGVLIAHFVEQFTERRALFAQDTLE